MTASIPKIQRLPGFYFESQVSLREDILPRMDVAVFVGFAASGPIGVPVVLESAEQFNNIFGKNLPLVRDNEEGKTLFALLPPTVRAFFRNGGKRCWVIRVALEKPAAAMPLNRACRNYFPLAGIAQVQSRKKSTLQITPAFVKARSKGTWSDDLQIGTAVSVISAAFINLFDSGNYKTLQMEIDPKFQVRAGETIKLKYAEGKSLFLVADTVEKLSPDSVSSEISAGNQVVEITSKRSIWLQDVPNVTLKRKVSVRFWNSQVHLHSNSFSDSALAYHSAVLTTEFEPIVSPAIDNANVSPTKIKLVFQKTKLTKLPEIGSFLLTRLEKKWLCLEVEKISFTEKDDNSEVEIICRGFYCRKEITEPHSKPQVQRISFELWLKQDANSLLKLKDLAFNSGHERFWGNLPTDELLYNFTQHNGTNKVQTNIVSGFPVAGNNDSDSFYFPVFAMAFPQNYLGGVTIQGTKIEREGLAKFDEDLFLDKGLKKTGLNALLTDAEFIKYISPTPRSLNGIHAALAPESVINQTDNSPNNRSYAELSLEEATIIAVPDVLHRGWTKKQDQSPTSVSFEIAEQPKPKETGEFAVCPKRIVKNPINLQVKSGAISGGSFTLMWTNTESIVSPPDKDNLQFILEESDSQNFRFPVKIYVGNQTEFKILRRNAGEYYYRVRTEINGVSSNWSNGLKVFIPATENWTAISKSDFSPDTLLAVHRSLLRLCTARGDMFAVLSLPEHFEKDDALRYTETLKAQETIGTAGVAAFNFDELKALSFGALYHTWMLTQEEGFDNLQIVPPCGFAVGVMALRAIKRGAWVAPANEILQSVLGLTQKHSREDLLEFQDNALNPVRSEPFGFVFLSSDTLSNEKELSSINVRRLLSLLRRLAIKHGNEYVFETNSEQFRRQVQQGFTSLLDVMFTRGAFAGKTPATSYQVNVSDGINTRRSLDLGRLIIELKVAPSQPLKFVTVRLDQTGGKSVVTEIV